MAATKENLIKLCDELFEKNIIGKGMLRDKKYDINNGHIQCSIRSCNPNTFKLIRKEFEKLGYIVKSAGYDYIDIYWTDTTTELIKEIFNKYQ